jgi:hypothetical protein
MSFISCSDPSLSSILNKPTSINFPSLGVNKEQLLERTILTLESERDDLISQVGDLRQLIKRIAQQQEKESLRKNKIHLDYQSKIKSLESALRISECHSSHLSSVLDFWKDFIN